MSDLLTKKCVPCEKWTPSLKGEKITSYLAELKNSWEVVDEKQIRYTFKFKTFPESVAFVDKIVPVAEGEGHHPDITIVYNKVTITLWTHFIKGLTENDFILAAKIEALL